LKQKLAKLGNKEGENEESSLMENDRQRVWYKSTQRGAG
jgi:hypothetical protein